MFTTHIINQRHSLKWMGIFLIFILAFGATYVARENSKRATVLVEWSTASELGTVGYNLYRGDRPEGPFAPINNTIIPAAIDPLRGGSYSYLDQAAIPGVTYYYELEEITRDGSSSRYGPIVIKAKRGGMTELIVSMTLFSVGIGAIIAGLRSRSENHAS
jgi:hypothetical protein